MVCVSILEIELKEGRSFNRGCGSAQAVLMFVAQENLRCSREPEAHKPTGGLGPGPRLDSSHVIRLTFECMMGLRSDICLLVSLANRQVQMSVQGGPFCASCNNPQSLQLLFIRVTIQCMMCNWVQLPDLALHLMVARITTKS